MSGNLFEDEEKRQATKDLCRIADLMETAERGSEFAKQLSREYKAAAIRAGIIEPNGKIKGWREKEMKPDKVKASKAACLEKIKAALDDFPKWEAEINSTYIGDGHIAFYYNVNHAGFPHEIQFMIVAGIYRAYSGYKAVKNRASLVSKKQLAGYKNLQYGLIKFALDIVPREEKQVFFDKYAVPYNNSIKK